MSLRSTSLPSSTCSQARHLRVGAYMRDGQSPFIDLAVRPRGTDRGGEKRQGAHSTTSPSFQSASSARLYEPAHEWQMKDDACHGSRFSESRSHDFKGI
jgi:hypothetical protein